MSQAGALGPRPAPAAGIAAPWRRHGAPPARTRARHRWWPFAALLALACALRFSTLGMQSLWYDEAFTPVHVFRASLAATMGHMAHTENTPPLWYVLEWVVIRLAGSGAVALRLVSAVAGLATVPVAWAIGAELGGRRAAILAAGLTATSPLFVWYSQEARAYGLYTFFCALAMWLFLRADREPTPRRVGAFALACALALLTHYFAVFLVVPMALWLVRRRERVAAGAPALLTIVLLGAALLPLALQQGGHGAEWIGKLSLASRLEAIPQYYLTGYSGAPLGHGVELLVALPLLAGVALSLWRAPGAAESRAALLALGLALVAVLLPLVLAGLGADFLDPRNVIGAMVPATACVAVLLGTRGAGRGGMALGFVAMLAFLAVCVEVDRSPRLQRGDWRGVAAILRHPAPGAPPASERLLVSVHLGTAPLRYYMPGLRTLPAGGTRIAREIDEIGYPQLSAEASGSPAPGFRLASKRSLHGLLVYRFLSSAPRAVALAAVLAHPFTLDAGARTALARPRAGAG